MGDIMARTSVSDVEEILEEDLVGQSNIQTWIDIASSVVDTIQDRGQEENLEKIEQLWTAHLIQSNPKNEGDRRKASVNQVSGSVEFQEGVNYGEMAMMLDDTGTLDPEDEREQPNIAVLDSRGLDDT